MHTTFLRIDKIKVLVLQKSNVDLNGNSKKSGQTIIHIACTYGHFMTVEMLIQKCDEIVTKKL